MGGVLLNEASLIWADLSGTVLNEARLDDAILSGADLSGAMLNGASLNEADLRQANLHRADLSGASLIWTLLDGADLSGAQLCGAILNGARLIGANLGRADLTGADLTSANLSEAKLSFTILGRLDLGGVNGLETVRHLGPSLIDSVTLALSRGRIPEGFLRDAGIPDFFLSALRPLNVSPGAMSICLLRYANEDRGFAQRIHADLERSGVRCYLAPHQEASAVLTQIGRDESLRLADQIVLILSKHAIIGHWVDLEVEMALQKERHRKRTVLFPICLDSAILESSAAWAAQLRHRHIEDFERWREYSPYQRAFTRLLHDLKMAAP